MFDATGLQLFQKGIMIALIMLSAYIALNTVRMLVPVFQGKAAPGAVAPKVLLRALIATMLLVAIIPLSSNTPKAEMKIQASSSRAQDMQRRDPAPEVKQSAPAYEVKAGDTGKLGDQVREDFEDLPNAEVPPLSQP